MRKTPRDLAGEEASPQKSVIEGLEALRKTVRAVCQRYASRLDDEIIQVREGVLAEAEKGASKKPARSSAEVVSVRVRDLRDMLMLLRSLQLKPDAGRRKDLKRIESTLSDLRLLAEQWK